MSRREVRKYIDDLLAGRPPTPFAPDEFEAAQLRAAIDLTAAREGADEPRPEFLSDLKERLAAGMAPASGAVPPAGPSPDRRAPSATRRQVIVATTAAATAAVAAVSVDRRLVHPGSAAQPGQALDTGAEMIPTNGSWQHVADSTELAEGAGVLASSILVSMGWTTSISDQPRRWVRCDAPTFSLIPQLDYA